MKRLLQIVMAVIAGFAVGFVLGPLSLLMAPVSDRLMRGWAWSDVKVVSSTVLLLSAIPAAINGALGALLVAGFDNRRRLGITALPVALHLGAAIWAAVEWMGEFWLLQLLALMLSVIAWLAGRIGQAIGGAVRNRNRTHTNS